MTTQTTTFFPRTNAVAVFSTKPVKGGMLVTCNVTDRATGETRTISETLAGDKLTAERPDMWTLRVDNWCQLTLAKLA